MLKFLFFNRKWNKIVVHFSLNNTCISPITFKRAIIHQPRLTNNERIFCSFPTLSKSSENKTTEGNAYAQDTKTKHNSKISDLEHILTRVDLDLRKYGCLNKDDIEAIVEEVRKHGTITETLCLHLIKCCGNCLPAELPEYKNKLVQEIWELSLKLGVSLNVSHFNALLKVYLENQHSFNPLRFLASLVEQDIQPNRVTYQRLVAAYCQTGDLIGAAKILEIMKHKNIAVDANVFNALVMGHSMIGDWESAKGIISAMMSSGIEPDSDTYRELLCGYAKHGISDCVSSLIDDCNKRRLTLSDDDLLAAVYVAAIHGHSHIVDMLLERMKKSLGYNRICVNVILRLIAQSREDEAFKVLLHMKPVQLAEGRTAQSGRFFIHHVVKSNCTSDKIISFCQQLVQTEKNVRAFFMALQAASSLERTDLVTCLLKEIKKDKHRHHFLGSVLTSESRSGGEDRVLSMLRKMAAVRLFPNAQTVQRYVLPHMTGDSQTLLEKLHSARASFFVISVALFRKSLDNLDFDDAIRIASTFYIDLDSKLRESIVTAYLKSKNAPGLAKVIRSLLPESEKSTSDYFSSEVVEPILKEICNQTSDSQRKSVIVPFLEALRQQGLGISLNMAHFLRETLGEGITPPVNELLAEMSSGALIPVELDSRPLSRLHWTNKDQVMRLRNEFYIRAREHKLVEALACKKEIEDQKIPFTDGMNLLLMDLYAYHEKLDQAMEVFSQLFCEKPELVVFPAKLMDLAARLLREHRIDDAFRVLQQLKIHSMALENAKLTSIVNRSAMRLMNAAAERGDVHVIQRILQLLENSKALKIGNSVLGALIKVHALHEDMESALEEFDRCANERRTTPWKQELTVRLIEKNDTEKLERLMRTNRKVHGEINTLYDLSFALLRCGRVSQAKEVLQTPGLRALNQRLNVICAFHVRNKRVDELENFVKISKDLFNVDRKMLYDHLLSACILADMPARAIDTWTMMQEEEDVLPHDDFLRRLGDFLIAKNMSVPFALPAVAT